MVAYGNPQNGGISTRTVTLVTIFVASPSELQPERLAVQQAARTVNLSYSRETGIYFEVVGWEDVPSNLGTDPQNVINQYFDADQYDVLIGIMADRLGSPTPRAASGTIEEYERALARHAIDSKSVHVKFFFKRMHSPPGENSEREAVEEFKRQVQEIVLWKEFDDAAELERLLNRDLPRTAKEISAAKRPVAEAL